MRVSQLRIINFRGWENLDLRPREHVVLAGVPRSGRSDIVAALRKVLDPASTRVQPRLTDLRQWSVAGGGMAMSSTALAEGTAPTPSVDVQDATGGDGNGGDSDGAPPAIERATDCLIEVTLCDLDPDIAQRLDGFLEPHDESGAAASEDADENAPMCVRLAYRIEHDPDADTLEHLVYFPARSNPTLGQFMRVPAETRRSLPVVVLQTESPLQLRAEGALRRLLRERDPDGASVALQRLNEAVTDATVALGMEPVVIDTLDAVLTASALGPRIGDEPIHGDDIGFVAEDGSLSALLRAVQPSLRLDTAGHLPLPAHGSTTTAILSAAEAILLAKVPGAVVLADDFGDHLDAPTAEHLASVIRSASGQAWLATRRPDVVRAFEATELVRISRHEGTRQTHQLTQPKDKKDIVALRQLQTQLLAALTSPVIALVEGPHDAAAYAYVDRHRVAPNRLAAHGVRIVATGTGNEGGTSRMPKVARLAQALGFRVAAVMDGDPSNPQTDSELEAVTNASDVVVRLPDGVAIEAAIVHGVDVSALRTATATLTAFGFSDPLALVTDDAKVPKVLIKAMHNSSYHEQVLAALKQDGVQSRLVLVILNEIRTAATSSADTVVQVTYPPKVSAA